MSDGVFQVERGVVTEADLTKKAGANYHPFSLRTVLYHRDENAAGVAVFLEIVDGDTVYVIDTVAALAGKDYQFPNERAPHKFDLVPGQRIQFRAVGAAGGAKQNVAITWAELGAP